MALIASFHGRNLPARYTGMEDMKKIIPQTCNGLSFCILINDFHPLYAKNNPTHTNNMDLLTFSQRIKTIPEVIQPEMAPPFTSHKPTDSQVLKFGATNMTLSLENSTKRT